ncbi:16S rRNA (cytosine(1407)-C(5))-methyltransferase RsmF [soil metagenome]
MHTLLEEETDVFLAAMREEVGGLRVNTLRASVERAREILPFQVEPLTYPREGFRYPSDLRPGRHPHHAAGLFYLQDPAAMVVGGLLDPRPGERVADLSAAPGGKATHLAARMGDSGFLLANDINAGRARELAGNLERCGVRNAVVTMESVERLADRLSGWFDRVLLDAPCSGEAMFCKSDAARSGWSEGAVAGCARRQEQLLSAAARLVRPGGLLVYSTCTFSAEEDERVIAVFLAAHPHFRMEEPPSIPGASPGRPEWVEPSLSRADLRHAVRLWPHRFPGAGHFIALLRRGAGDEIQLPPAAEPEPLPGQVSLLEQFRRAHLKEECELPRALTLRGSELFSVAAGAPTLHGVRVFRPGWWLGTLHRDRFEPAHALAMGLKPEHARDVLDLSADDVRVHSFLRGETLHSQGDQGWVLITTDGLPLGWGKRVGFTTKNHLPKGLRTMG